MSPIPGIAPRSTVAVAESLEIIAPYFRTYISVAKFVYNIPTALEEYFQDHLQECKFVLFAVLAAITAIAAICALCVLVPAVLKSVVPIGKFVLSTLKMALNSILYPIIWVLKWLETCFAYLSRTMHRGAGVAARGVRPIDVDARGQLGFLGQRTRSAGVLSRLRARMGLC
ncbi:hypothetical protein C8Q74DRAFT_1242869 [Fomes fomentarius]|nr:hypothetical protein C8Q74DRAFT_1242869 [Fomes fomentarius]